MTVKVDFPEKILFPLKWAKGTENEAKIKFSRVFIDLVITFCWKLHMNE